MIAIVRLVRSAALRSIFDGNITNFRSFEKLYAEFHRLEVKGGGKTSRGEPPPPHGKQFLTPHLSTFCPSPPCISPAKSLRNCQYFPLRAPLRVPFSSQVAASFLLLPPLSSAEFRLPWERFGSERPRSVFTTSEKLGYGGPGVKTYLTQGKTKGQQLKGKIVS